MSRELDALTASTLKGLRERWWDDSFAGFLAEVLQPRLPQIFATAGRRLAE